MTLGDLRECLWLVAVCPCLVGYVYLVFENEKSVRALLHACSPDPFHPDDNREYYFKMSSRRMRCKDVSGPVAWLRPSTIRLC